MKTFSKRTTSCLSLHATTLVLASALGAIGCYDTPVADDSPLPGAASGAGSNDPVSELGGSDSGGASDASFGGASATRGGRGGAELEGGRDDIGGKPAQTEPNLGGREAGGTGSAPESGGTSNGGSAPELEAGSSGGLDASGGTTNAGGAGSEEEPPPAESICFDDEGAPIPYDYSFGVASEYAFELSMSCDVGGYLMPLMLADPEQLSLVNAFVADATDWYRAEILRCEGEAASLGEDAYGLLPISESADLSAPDFDASFSLFTAVLDRHDGLPDGVSKTKKDKIKQRIKSFKQRAVHGPKDALTKTLSEPDCMPTAPPADG